MAIRGPKSWVLVLSVVAALGLVAFETQLSGPIPAPITAASTTTIPSPVPGPPVTMPGGWSLVGGDEFDGTSVDPARWRVYHNTYGDGNNEMACLTPDNVAVSGGSLKITARQEQVRCPNGSVRRYSSGFLGSREVGVYHPRYARFEMRAKVPHAQGLWPAFWLRHRNGSSTAEVDILEYLHILTPGRGDAALHLDGSKNTSKRGVWFEAPDGASGWHVWAVEISPDPSGVRFEFFLDGARFHSYVDTEHRWTAADPAATWDIAVNLAVGGRWAGDPDGPLGYLPDLGRCSIGGTPPDRCTTTGINRADWSDPEATTYEIDYLRVYTR